MASRSLSHKRRSLWITMLILVAIGLKFYIESQQPDDAKSSRPSPTPAQIPGQSRTSARPAADADKIGGYEVYRNCTLAEARNNDGDSSSTLSSA
ncbi:MAG: hypothetical protein V4819_19395 [Verrucomicrobiota bacterium]